MPTLAAAKTSNAGYCPSYLPVAVIFGGTSGIGQAITETLAEYLKGRVHIVIVARNKAAADAIIASLPIPIASDAAGSKYEFMACDVTLMKNVHTACRELSERLPKINFLVLSAGVFALTGREETEEGIDKKMASRYYSRWAIIHDLLPSLRKAKEAGEDASVLSILGAGIGWEVDVEDLGLKKRYTALKAMMQTISYNDYMIAEYAKREPEIAFTHISPGTVDTPGLYPSSWLLTILMLPLRPFLWLISAKPQDCAEYMLFALLNAEKGVNRRNPKGDGIGSWGFPQAVDGQKRVWDHSAQLTGV
ncbi:hypothetical protein K443DRAFT_676611 [Laccaria amethystina LaAM-08-1]|uniref:NAD(P)-binding protein n=1 Tax=Laccaria amethystina LaAM-08-1 TaxID=1095629 RepID=A0A0C9Y0T5_9AGAR|nr:hypothetical protein K443DRAFT_676611 [Laccaria amethystina LaAM-08-1]